VAVERAFLAALDGSCRTPIAGLAEIEGSTVTFRGEIIRPDGSARHEVAWSGPAADGPEAARDLGEGLKGKAGAGFFD
jgi:hydroxymethylbilane synthase